MVPGVRVHGASVTDVEITVDETFVRQRVPVPDKLGVPLLWKKSANPQEWME